MLLDGDGNVDLERTLERLRTIMDLADYKADNARYYANQMLSCGGSYFDFEDARDDSVEWSCKAHDARQAIALIEKIRLK